MPLPPLLTALSRMFAVKRPLTGTLLAISFVAGAGGQQHQPKTSSGSSSQVSIPAWVPVYPGAKVGVPTSSQGRTELNIWFTISTGDPCNRVWRFYEERLNLAGFSVVKGTQRDGCVIVLESHDPAGRKVNLSGGSFANGTRYQVEVVQLSDGDRSGQPGNGTRKDSTTVNSGIPSWLPVYPQSAPRNLQARQSGPEYFVSFTFTTRDDARSILSWYQDKLRQMGFRVDMDVAGTAGALRSNTRDNSRAVKIEVSAAGGQNVVLLEVRDQK
jgi:hypothetical protein